MPLDQAALAAQIFSELQTRLLDQSDPPADAREGIQRLSDGIATAVVAHLKANAVVTVEGTQGTIA